jgi:hypothetical protein
MKRCGVLLVPNLRHFISTKIRDRDESSGVVPVIHVLVPIVADGSVCEGRVVLTPAIRDTAQQ